MNVDHEIIVGLAERIAGYHNAADEEEFAKAILPVIRSMAARRSLRCRPDFDDIVQESAWALILQLRDGKLRDTNAIWGYVQRIVIGALRTSRNTNRALCELNEAFGVRHPDPSPESAVIGKSMAELEFDVLQSILKVIPPLNLEILVRFYVHEQSKEQICDDLNITPTQFRLAKSRTKILVSDLISSQKHF